MEYIKPMDNDHLHCPICGRELKESQRTGSGWLCTCGEFIPLGLAVHSYLGSTERINPHYEGKRGDS